MVTEAIVNVRRLTTERNEGGDVAGGTARGGHKGVMELRSMNSSATFFSKLYTKIENGFRVYVVRLADGKGASVATQRVRASFGEMDIRKRGVFFFPKAMDVGFFFVQS